MTVDLNDCPDAELLRRVAGQDRAALAALYDRHGGVLYATMLRIIGDPTDSQDALHDAFLHISRKAGAYDPSVGRAVGWMVTVARNLALDRVRQTARRRDLLAERGPEDTEGPSGVDEILRRDDTHRLGSAVAGLPADQRQALELAYFGGYTHEEIATRLQQPIGTVKARIRRGLLKLRAALTGSP